MLKNQSTIQCIGDYEILEEIGGGSQGKVFKAKKVCNGTDDIPEGMIVALKTFRGELEQKIGVLLGLHHRNVVRYLEVFKAVIGFDECQCLVMEYLEGATLDQIISENPRGVVWERACKIITAIMRGLNFAFSYGIIHRDVKPGNIFITNSGDVKIIDFDVAKAEHGGVTTVSGFCGSFDYMSPDFVVVEGFHGDVQSDIFSLTICIYEMLAGHLPFKPLRENADIGYTSRWSRDPVAKLKFSSGVLGAMSPEINDFLLSGLFKDKSKRYKNYKEMFEKFKVCKHMTIYGKHTTYHLEEYIGKGGFGRVYKAYAKELDCYVAVKRLSAPVDKADQYIKRFKSEAESIRSISHNHIVKYVDFITQIDDGIESYFLVMEFLEGMPENSLSYRLKFADDGLPLLEVLQFFICFADALDSLHANNIIHRDVKPANLYAPEGHPEKAKLFDLGIVRNMTGTKTSGNVPGTLEYMAPEFTLSKERGSSRTDMFSLGLCFYKALTGKNVFPALSKSSIQAVQDYCARAQGKTPANIDYHLPVFKEYPKLAVIVAKAVALNPKKRYANLSDFANDLKLVLNQASKVVYDEDVYGELEQEFNEDGLTQATSALDENEELTEMLKWNPGANTKKQIEKRKNQAIKDINKKPEKDSQQYDSKTVWGSGQKKFMWLLPSVAMVVVILSIAFFSGRQVVSRKVRNLPVESLEQNYLDQLGTAINYVTEWKKLDFIKNWNLELTKLENKAKQIPDYAKDQFNRYSNNVESLKNLKKQWDNIQGYCDLMDITTSDYEKFAYDVQKRIDDIIPVPVPDDRRKKAVDELKNFSISELKTYEDLEKVNGEYGKFIQKVRTVKDMSGVDDDTIGELEDFKTGKEKKIKSQLLELLKTYESNFNSLEKDKKTAEMRIIYNRIETFSIYYSLLYNLCSSEISDAAKLMKAKLEEGGNVIPVIPKGYVDYFTKVNEENSFEPLNLMVNLGASKMFVDNDVDQKFSELWKEVSLKLSTNLLNQINLRGSELSKAKFVLENKDCESVLANFDELSDALAKQEQISYLTISNSWSKPVEISYIDDFGITNEFSLQKDMKEKITLNTRNKNRDFKFNVFAEGYEKNDIKVLDIIPGYDYVKPISSLRPIESEISYFVVIKPSDATGLEVQYKLKDSKEPSYIKIDNKGEKTEIVTGDYDIIIGADDYEQTNMSFTAVEHVISRVTPTWVALRTQRLKDLDKFHDIMDAPYKNDEKRKEISSLCSKPHKFDNSSNQSKWDALKNKWNKELSGYIAKAKEEYEKAIGTNTVFIETYARDEYNKILRILDIKSSQPLNEHIDKYNEASSLVPEALEKASAEKAEEDEKLQKMIVRNNSKINDFIGWYYEIGNPDGVGESLYRKNISKLTDDKLESIESNDDFEIWNEIFDICRSNEAKNEKVQKLRSIFDENKLSKENQIKLAVLIDMIDVGSLTRETENAGSKTAIIYRINAHKNYSASVADKTSKVIENLNLAKSHGDESLLTLMDYIIGIYNAYAVWENTTNDDNSKHAFKAASENLKRIMDDLSPSEAKNIALWLSNRTIKAEQILYILSHLSILKQTPECLIVDAINELNIDNKSIEKTKLIDNLNSWGLLD